MQQRNGFKIYKQIGKGSFGKVFLAQKNHKLYALKELRKASLIKAKQVDHALNEVRILSQISHPFTVKMHQFFQDKSRLSIVSQFVQGGQLFGLLRDEGSFDRKRVVHYAAMIVLIFQYLHNLKPQNILVDIDGYLKLTDFGFAKVVSDRTYTLCGTPQYLAPQILSNNGHGKPVDWWTLGVLVYELLAGIDPFADLDPLTIYQNILKCRLKFPKNFDKEGKSLVKHLLVSDLSRRYGNMSDSPREIKQHRFFAELKWEQLLEKKIGMEFLPKLKPLDVEQSQPEKEEELEQVTENDPFLQQLKELKI